MRSKLGTQKTRIGDFQIARFQRVCIAKSTLLPPTRTAPVSRVETPMAISLLSGSSKLIGRASPPAPTSLDTTGCCFPDDGAAHSRPDRSSRCFLGIVRICSIVRAIPPQEPPMVSVIQDCISNRVRPTPPFREWGIRRFLISSHKEVKSHHEHRPRSDTPL